MTPAYGVASKTVGGWEMDERTCASLTEARPTTRTTARTGEDERMRSSGRDATRRRWRRGGLHPEKARPVPYEMGSVKDAEANAIQRLTLFRTDRRRGLGVPRRGRIGHLTRG